MNTFILVLVMISQSYDGHVGGVTTTTQEFNSEKACIAAGEFATASSEELNEPNSARYKCIIK